MRLRLVHGCCDGKTGAGTYQWLNYAPHKKSAWRAEPASVKTTSSWTALAKKHVVQAPSCHPVVFPSHHPSVVGMYCVHLFALFYHCSPSTELHKSLSNGINGWVIHQQTLQGDDMGSREEDVTRPKSVLRLPNARFSVFRLSMLDHKSLWTRQISRLLFLELQIWWV